MPPAKRSSTRKKKSSAKKSSARKKSAPSRSSKKRPAAKRDLVKTPTGTFFAHRNPDGSFLELDEQGRSLSADRRTKSSTAVKSGFGGQGDRAPRKKK